MNVFGLFMYHSQIAEGKESAIQTTLQHSIHRPWNKQQFCGDCHKLQRPWVPVRQNTYCTGRRGEAWASSVPRIKHIDNFYSGCHRDARARRVPHVHKMSDAFIGRKQRWFGSPACLALRGGYRTLWEGWWCLNILRRAWNSVGWTPRFAVAWLKLIWAATKTGCPCSPANQTSYSELY